MDLDYSYFINHNKLDVTSHNEEYKAHYYSNEGKSHSKEVNSSNLTNSELKTKIIMLKNPTETC